MFINAWPNRKLLDYTFKDQIKDILPSVLLAAGMGACVYTVQYLGLNDFLTLIIQVPLGAVIYTAGSKLLRLDSFSYLWGILRDRIRKQTP